MRKIWFVIVFASLVILCFTEPENGLNAMLNAGSTAVSMSIKLLGVYAVWLGLLGIVEETGLNNKISALLSPVIDFFFFFNIPSSAKNYIAMNMSANMLGMGNACTPMGIKAMHELDKVNPTTTATTAMIMLMVINATSIQLLPTTIMGLRVAYGSTTASDIIIPSLLSTIISTVAGIALVKLCAKIFAKKGIKK